MAQKTATECGNKWLTLVTPLTRPGYRRRLHRQPGVDGLHGGDLVNGHPSTPGEGNMPPHQGTHDQGTPNKHKTGYDFSSKR